MSNQVEGQSVSPNDAKPVVSGSKVIDESRIKDFIKHWERIIYPYNEENDQHRAVKTVLVELENVCRAYCH